MTPTLADGIVEAIRLARIARNSAVEAPQAIVAPNATRVTANEDPRVGLEPLSDHKLMVACACACACARADTDGDPADPDTSTRQVLASLARRCLDLHDEIKSHMARLETLTAAAAPKLVAAFGVGPDIAGELLVAAGDNSGRISNEATFAKLFGACLVPTGVWQDQRPPPAQPRRESPSYHRPLRDRVRLRPRRPTALGRPR